MEVTELRVTGRRRLPASVMVVAMFAAVALFGILVAVLTEPPHVAFVDSCLLVAFPLGLVARRRCR